MNSETHFEQARANPTHFYSTPQAVVNDDALDCGQKLEILRHWESEATHLQESEAEGFQGGETDQLDRIKQAIEELGG